MGKYTLVAQNQLGSAESTCDLIVAKKQFPPVFWQRLYNVNGEGSRRFVGEVEVGGWPVPQVYWYKVMEDGEEVEVKTKTHTENWNGNPNKYVPDSRIEVRQIDQIRHVIIFHQVSDGDSGLYRVRAINALGEAECEAELYFDGLGGSGDDLYLPLLWKERKRLTWRDEDMRKKPCVGYQEPELTPEELAEMRKKHGGVPLNRIMEYLASLPDYVPSERFRHMDRMPFKPGVDERDYRPDRKGGKCSYPSVFKKGNYQHHGYVSDALGRILPVWYNPADPRARDSSMFKWKPVHPDLFVPEIPPRSQSPSAPPVWEKDEDIKVLISLLNSMGCRVANVTEIRQAKLGNKQQQTRQSEATNSHIEMHTEAQKTTSKHTQQTSKIEKFSYIMPNEKDKKVVEAEHLPKAKDVKNMWEERLNANAAGAQSNALDFTSQFMSQMYDKRDNLSFPELDDNRPDRPALPPKTKIMNSPSRNIFSPTESIESNSYGTASVKTVEFLPVREKVKMIAAQQEELNRKEELNSEKKNKGVRVLPPSPITVRKMSVDDELFQYDEVVTRSTPVTQVLEKMSVKPLSPVQPDIFTHAYQSNVKSHSAYDQDYSSLDSGISQSVSSFEAKKESQFSYSYTKTSMHQESMSATSQRVQGISVPGWSGEGSVVSKVNQQEALAKSAADKEIEKALDQLIAETESMVSNDNTFESESSIQQYQAYSSQAVTQSTNIMNSVLSSRQAKHVYESPAEECRRSFEEAELEAMALESETSKSFSKQSSVVESCSTKSFVMQEQNSMEKAVYNSSSLTKESTGYESSFRSKQPLKSNSFVRTPETFLNAKASTSAPSTPMSQRRRLRINQSPKPTDSSDAKMKYREGPNAPFQPGFYRPPPEDPEKSHVFQLVRRSSSRARLSNERVASVVSSQESCSGQPQGVRTSQASSHAYEGDYESEV